MNLIDRISLAVRSTANSLLVKKPTTPEERTAALLSTAQKRLDALSDKLVQATAREKRAEQEWREALALSASLSGDIDAAVKTGQTEAARGKLEQTRLAQLRTQQLEGVYHNAASFTEKLRIEIAATRAQLEQARKRFGQAAPPPAAPVAQVESARPDQAASTAPAATDAPDSARIADILQQKKRKDG